MKKPLFSERTAWDLSENDLARDLGAARGEGRPLVDLTESNPTRAGLASTEALIALLGHPRGASYAPIALGHASARAAVVGYYAERGLALPMERIALSASTSEAYGWLFKLLTERGDKVLVPAPSYPLFAFLAALEDVELVPYPLMREEGFRIDLAALEAAIDEDTRAILLVHPNNPTGSFVRRDEADALEAIALRHGLAIISDEVFGDYAFPGLPQDRLPSFVGARRALTFVLSGLSKVVALPQLKLGWIAVLGPDDVAMEAMRRLEVIADTYLSVGTPVQLALPEILAARGPIQAAIRARTARNLAALDGALAALGAEAPARRLAVEGGWYAILEIPRTRDEDAWVQLFVRDEGIIVHPGYFFDLPDEGFLVVSLLPDEAAFAAAIKTVVRRLGEA
jgi:alanine-synthesizing transaminase